ncbi:MAG: phage tail protein I [Brevundimonas sp.]|uniref:phage tail protein I n=1 Tax=Brevundimonas sp. TaxID=1871086 RepID=UPI00391AACFF
MTSLLPPTSTPLERAVEILSRRLDGVAVPLRSLWDPWTCPLNLLPWLAYALSIDAWNPGWPEEVKRSVIAHAIEIQRKKGTAASVRQVVTAFGGQIALREWWQLDPPGAPHTFDLVLTLNGQNGAPATARFVEEVVGEVSRTKPARSHFTFLQGLKASGAVALGGGARVAVYRRLSLSEAPIAA